jgi:hypothetical protein
MKKLLAWLNKNNYSHKPAFYGSSYFYNVPEIRKEAAEITISSNNIKEVTKQADKLRKYASRYNYTIKHESRINCTYYGEYYTTLFLLPDADAAALEHYYFFQDAAAAECELLIHEYHEAGKHETHAAELNTQLRAIMDNYGAMYNRSFIKISAA